MILEKQEEVFKRNYNSIKLLFGVGFSLGVNLTARSRTKDALKILHVIITVSSFISLYGHWSYLKRHINSMPLIAESVYTALEILMAVTKMTYFFFTHRIFYRLLEQTLRHDIIYKIEILKHDFPINQELKREIDGIMNEVWRNTRRLLLFFFYSCLAIVCNYFFVAFFINVYHHMKRTPGFTFVLPLPAVYPSWESKGKAFPYFHFQMFITTAAIHISGMGAVCFDGVFIVLCKHAVGLMKVHNLLVLHATSPLIPAERRVEYLQYVIITYQRINKYMLEVQTIYRHISLSQFLLSLISFGFILFQINYGLESDINNFIRMIMYIMAAGTQITLYCYHGQALTNVNEEIPLVYYNCIWYGENETFKQLIMMMIMRTNKEFNLEVSWFSLMNWTTMINLFRASGSYYLLLKNFQEN